MTYFLRPSNVLDYVSSKPGGLFAAQFIFDTPGTIGGLLGVVLLLSPILVGTDQKYRVRLSTFFFVGSVSIGLFATFLWNQFYNAKSATIPYGSSSIAIAAQAMDCALALICLIRLGTLDKSRDSSFLEKYRRYSLAIVDVTLILTTLWYVLILQPIDVPTNLFNWKIHEIAFILGTVAALVYGCASLLQESRARKKKVEYVLE